ncbi:MAG: hypothetical protein HZB26_00995 [Candidatus Hydrogenedentes bacterium]|nr:hypothetical protein [Candidatus Hydrogenedentota bacterium]
MDPERRKRLLIIAAAICIGAFALDRLVITPSFEYWNGRSAQIQELDKEIAESGGLLDREGELRQRWDTMKTQSLPKRVSDAESLVFQSVSRWASESKLSVTSLKPRWVKVPPMAQTLEIQLEGTGNIENLSKFLFALETDALPLRVEDLQVSAQDDKGEKLALSVRFSGLVLEETST